MKNLALKISGMHCDGCAETIEALLAAEPGVQASSASYTTGTARVLYDPATTETSRLIAAIERAGYRVEAQ